MNFKRTAVIVCLILALSCFLLVGCDSCNLEEMPEVIDENFSESDFDTSYDEKSAVKISLEGKRATCSAEGAEASEGLVTVTKGGAYVFKGSFDGGIVVDADKKEEVRIVLDGADISNGSGAALYVKSAKKTTVTVKEGASNSLKSLGGFVQTDDNNVDGAVFSKDDVTFNGKGTLAVECGSAHGIVSKDDLVFTGGKISVNAAKQALSGKDCIKVAGGEFSLVSGSDGLHSVNADDPALGNVYIAGGTFDMEAAGDGIDASGKINTVGGKMTVRCGGKGIKGDGGIAFSAEADIDSADDGLHSSEDITVLSGSLKIATGDDAVHSDKGISVTGGSIDIVKSHEGLEAHDVLVSGGVISIKADDDGINAGGGNDGSGGVWGTGGAVASAASIKISGGKINVDSLGDGIDSNGNISISGGELYITGSFGGFDSPVDFDGKAAITGGKVIAVGAKQMSQNFSSQSEQGSLLLNFSSALEGAVSLENADGEIIAEYTPARAGSFDSVLISCPELQKGGDYLFKSGAFTLNINMTSLVMTYGRGGR